VGRKRRAGFRILMNGCCSVSAARGLSYFFRILRLSTAEKRKNNRKNESNLNYLYDLFFPFLFFLPYSAIIDSRKRKTIVIMNQT
jgi:hypothetical protein